MGAIASEKTSLTIVYLIVNSGADHRKHRSSASLAFCEGNSAGTGEFLAQMASNAENVSIWWRQYVCSENLNVERQDSSPCNGRKSNMSN